MPDVSTIVLADLVPLELIVFIFFTLCTLLGGAGVVFSRTLFHSALSLILSLFGVAGYYVLLSAGFLAVVQVMVYVGAIAILILFAIMFSRSNNQPEKGQSNHQWWISLPVVSVLFLILMFVIGSVAWPVSDVAPPSDMVEQLGVAFLGSYLIPFQVIGVLLSVALIGGVILARDRVDTEEM